MAITATVILIDSLNRQVRKVYETTDTVLADAKTHVAAMVAELEAVTDLGVVSVSYTDQDDSLASAAAANSNTREGATFRVRLDNGKVGVHKIPGFPISKADSDGNIPVSDADVAAYFTNFESGESFRLSDGQYITAVLSGKMDK